ncbi:hypothetical protein KDM87_05370 [Undibacterium sp. FT147W]|uniref:Uncharacterized protein n=1 Tax=Undibacterium rivi TaxID=2828729 RepID=A0ABS5GZY1_9BURK|nr:hypothetical protein [Undibacterium rivi]MBR7792020.1 hypothetical protein [Undibacterium rivi]
MKISALHSFSVFICLYCASILPAHSANKTAPCKIFGSWRECISAPMADDVDEKLAKELHTPTAEKAKLYLVRSGFVAAQLPTRVSLDQKHIATLAPDTFIALEVSPGIHQLGSATFGGNQIERDFKAGVAYFYKVNLGIYFNQRNEHISTISQSETQQLLAQLHLVKIDHE